QQAAQQWRFFVHREGGAGSTRDRTYEPIIGEGGEIETRVNLFVIACAIHIKAVSRRDSYDSPRWREIDHVSELDRRVRGGGGRKRPAARGARGERAPLRLRHRDDARLLLGARRPVPLYRLAHEC